VEVEQEKGDEMEGKRFFVAVHVGAGYHSPSNDKALRSVMNRACQAAASVLSSVNQPSNLLYFHFQFRSFTTFRVSRVRELA